MNYIRVLIGGIVAGVIVDLGEGIGNIFFREDWAAAMRALGKTSEPGTSVIVLFNIWGLFLGILAVWTYAAIRPRFGPGPRTAAIAAVAVWFSQYLLGMIPAVALDLFPAALAGMAIILGLIELVAGTTLGAMLYRETKAEASAVRAAGAS